MINKENKMSNFQTMWYVDFIFFISIDQKIIFSTYNEMKEYNEEQHDRGNKKGASYTRVYEFQ